MKRLILGIILICLISMRLGIMLINWSTNDIKWEVFNLILELCLYILSVILICFGIKSIIKRNS